MTRADQIPGIADIEAAAARLAGHAVRTPLHRSAALDERAGRSVLLKCECLQRIGAFKFRGAFNALSLIDFTSYPGGVVACSSGNHAQGVAAAAAAFGVGAVIVMPIDAPRIKIARTKALGAEVVLYDRLREDRDAIARAIGETRSAAFVPPFDDGRVIAGQGTVGLEIVAQAAAVGVDVGAIAVPCSGGGLAGGIAIAARHADARTRIYVVEPEGFDDMGRSLRTGRPQVNARLEGTICDALMAPSPGRLTFSIGRNYLAGGLAVSDAEVMDAMRFAFDELKLVLEPGGAAALAAMLAGRVPAGNGSVVVVLSGGNVDAGQFAGVLAG